MLPLAYIKSSCQHLASKREGVTVQIKTRGIGIEKYIEEELLAPLPLYREGAGRSIVFTTKKEMPESELFKYASGAVFKLEIYNSRI
jgi:hypothetical protein